MNLFGLGYCNYTNGCYEICANEFHLIVHLAVPNIFPELFFRPCYCFVWTRSVAPPAPCPGTFSRLHFRFRFDVPFPGMRMEE